jgi:hypothetical protein
MSAESTQQRHYAVILHTDGTFTTEEFESGEALAARLKALVNCDVSVSCFCGQRLFISKPPLRYLMTAAGNIPLFDVNAEVQPDDTGYLGVDPANLEEPPQLRVERSAPSSDDFFNDDDEPAINIFDSAMPDPDS